MTLASRTLCFFHTPRFTIGIRMMFVPILLSLWGCNGPLFVDPQVREAMNVPLDPDIIRVHTLYGNNIFMSFDSAGDVNPEGFRVTYYAVSSQTRKGAYGDGLIRIKLFVVRHPPDQAPVGELVKTWEYTPEQAMGWRVKKQAIGGWPYEFFLNWGDADVYGQEIRIVPEFVRKDGAVVRGSPKSLKVPPLRRDVTLQDAPQN